MTMSPSAHARQRTYTAAIAGGMALIVLAGCAGQRTAVTAGGATAGGATAGGATAGGATAGGATAGGATAGGATANRRSAAPTSPTVDIVVETALGNITIALDSVHAPRTVTNFLRYVDSGHFTNGQFHRTVTPDNQPRDSVRIEVIQGSVRRMRPDSGFGAIPLEPTSVTGLRHVDGTISMARAGPHTATSSFFIVIGHQPELDEGGKRQKDGQGFAAFGQVTKGMDVVRTIQRAPHTDQNLTPAIPILSVRRVTP